ncbi:DUF6166 domain-containing protein [Capnocytophaga gingivalis]|nr:DUF6166 domain-containing protein [Capnocytophaga gingivalis]
MTVEKRPTLSDFDFSRVKVNPGPPTENKARILLRIVEGAGVALWQSDPESTPTILIQKGNLFPSPGGYTWGYKGGGCKNLAFAMVTVIYQDDHLEKAELSERAYKLVEDYISVLQQDQPHDLSVAYIRKFLGDRELPAIYDQHR